MVIQTERAKSLIFAIFVAYNKYQGLPPFLFQRGQEVFCTALVQWEIVPPTELRMVPVAYRGGYHLAGVMIVGTESNSVPTL